MDDVVPLCASHVHCVGTSSPPSIWTLSYHKARHSFKAMVEILKMIRIPGPFCERGQSGNLFVGNDLLWYFFSFFPLFCMWASFMNLVVIDSLTPIFIVFIGGGWVHTIAVYSVCYWHREMSPFRLIGARGKFKIEVIPMIFAAALPHLLGFNYGILALLLGCTTYFYTFAYFMHAAYDIGGKDVLLGSSMLVLVHMLNKELLVGALALSFCLFLSLYRCMTYCAPELPIHCKKELEELPC